MYTAKIQQLKKQHNALQQCICHQPQTEEANAVIQLFRDITGLGHSKVSSYAVESIKGGSGFSFYHPHSDSVVEENKLLLTYVILFKHVHLWQYYVCLRKR